MECKLIYISNQLGTVIFRSHKEQINTVLMFVPAIVVVVVGRQLSTKYSFLGSVFQIICVVVTVQLFQLC